MTKVVVGVVICTIILLVVMTQVDNYNSNVINGEYTTLVDENSITATITGEVVRPGTYILELDTTLNDLVMAASGLTSNADDDAFDLTYVLSNNISFYIAPEYDNLDACSKDPIVKVNINSADKEQLLTINAIGDTIATNIISYRETSSFRRIEDIKNVSGIGTATFEKIKNYITIK